MIRKFVAIGLLALSSGVIAAGSSPEGELAGLIQANTKGKVVPSAVHRTPVPGIFEVVTGMDVFYVDATGRYAFVEGHMLDLKETKDLTQARLEKVSSIVFKDLPFELALKTVRGNGKRKVAVFEDPNCSYCRAFRTLLNHLDDVTIYSFPYPVLSADSEAKVRSVLCAQDRAKAWDVLMSTGKTTSAAACKADVASLVQLGQRLNVSGTPTVFFANGRRSQGAVPPDQFMAMLEEASR